MHDPETFETRLAVAIRRYAADDPRQVDALTLARSIATTHAGGSTMRNRGVRPWPRRSLARIVLAATVVVVLAAGAALVGSRLIDPGPVPLIPPERGVFTPTGRPIEDRHDSYTATLLDDGRVLIVGGYGSQGTAEVWDPVTETFAATGPLVTPQFDHSATLLADGRVLILGGRCDECPDNLIVAQLWDPTTDAFTLMKDVPSMGALRVPFAVSRRSPLLLDDGRVLIGRGPEAEVFDPATDTFEPAGALGDLPDPPYGTQLADGRVLVFRGTPPEVWDPVTGDFTPTGAPLEPRDAEVAVLLQDGRVLVAGGMRQAEGNGLQPVLALASAEIWDPASGRFSATGSLARGAYYSTPTLLRDGRVLVVLPGMGDAPASAELFELK